jgi:hypothetical protein
LQSNPQRPAFHLNLQASDRGRPDWQSYRGDQTVSLLLIIPASLDLVNCFLALVRVSPVVLKGIFVEAIFCQSPTRHCHKQVIKQITDKTKDHDADSICRHHSRLGAIPPEPYSQLQTGRMATGNAVVASTLHAKSSTALSTMLGMAPGQREPG